MRRSLRIRRAELTALPADLDRLDLGPEVVAFRRGPGFACVVDFAGAPVAIPTGATVIAASGPLADGRIPSDTTVWLRVAPPDVNQPPAAK